LSGTQVVQIVDKVAKTLVPSDKRHRIIAGGRGKGASWSIARILLLEGMQEPLFIPCVREVQKTIKYSVKRLLDQTIQDLHLDWWYDSYDNEIRGKNGTLFAFFGLRDYNADNIKSLEGADRCWVAEAQAISRRSINVLRPTIRKDGSVVWWDFNPRYETDPIYIDYITNKDDNAEVLWLSWEDNAWFTDALESERKADYSRDEIEAAHIWEGKLRDMGERYVCPSAIVLGAQKRNLKLVQGTIVVGADIAHQGGDEIVFYRRIGNKVVDAKYMKLKSVPDTVRALKRFMIDTSVILNVDNGHVGAAVADIMEEAGYIVNRINFGGRPVDVDHYEDVATEMWFNVRDQLSFIDIPNDEQLYNQLIQRKYAYINGRRGYEVVKIESKDDYKEHAQHVNSSPDRADALVLCFYEPEDTGTSFELIGNVM
jgi:PBSX family phage terminase large subunit